MPNRVCASERRDPGTGQSLSGLSQEPPLVRLDGMHQPRTIVIGGGLAGSTAAATLSRAGRPVLLLEAAEHAGGRARTRRRDGFDLNLGPHALYRAGGGLGLLRRLGVRVAGRIPRVDQAAVLLTATSSRLSIICGARRGTASGWSRR